LLYLIWWFLSGWEGKARLCPIWSQWQTKAWPLTFSGGDESALQRRGEARLLLRLARRQPAWRSKGDEVNCVPCICCQVLAGQYAAPNAVCILSLTQPVAVGPEQLPWTASQVAYEWVWAWRGSLVETKNRVVEDCACVGGEHKRQPSLSEYWCVGEYHYLIQQYSV
jgi:hypothetical protein